MYLLDIAAEIERSLMVQYLYAAYSLGGPSVTADKQPPGGGVAGGHPGDREGGNGAPAHRPKRASPDRGSLNLDREDFPWDIPFYPFDFALGPLTRTSLAKYVFAEAPADWPPDVTQSERAEIEGAVRLRISEALSARCDPEDLTRILSERLAEFLDLFQFYVIVYKENSTEIEWAVLGSERSLISAYADVPVRERLSWRAYDTTATVPYCRLGTR